MNVPEPNDKVMRWVAIAFIVLVGVAYFVWLAAVYAKFIETNRRIGAMAEEFYKMDDAPVTVPSTVVEEDAD